MISHIHFTFSSRNLMVKFAVHFFNFREANSFSKLYQPIFLITILQNLLTLSAAMLLVQLELVEYYHLCALWIYLRELYLYFPNLWFFFSVTSWRLWIWAIIIDLGCLPIVYFKFRLLWAVPTVERCIQWHQCYNRST